MAVGKGGSLISNLLIHCTDIDLASSVYPVEVKNCLFLLCNQGADKSWPRNFKESIPTLFLLVAKDFPAMVLELSSNGHVTIYLAVLSTRPCLAKEHLCAQEGGIEEGGSD